MKYDISVHFSTKNATVEELSERVDDYFKNTSDLLFDFSEPTKPRTVLHHCFLPEKEGIEKGFPDVYELLNDLSEMKVCWHGTSGMRLVWDRKLMLENLKKVGGLAVFIGEIIGGVQDEFNLVKELGIDYILI